jgi:hypothetical protein
MYGRGIPVYIKNQKIFNTYRKEEHFIWHSPPLLVVSPHWHGVHQLIEGAISPKPFAPTHHREFYQSYCGKM